LNREKNQFSPTFPVAPVFPLHSSQLREKQSPDWGVKAVVIPSSCIPTQASEAVAGEAEGWRRLLQKALGIRHTLQAGLQTAEASPGVPQTMRVGGCRYIPNQSRMTFSQ